MSRRNPNAGLFTGWWTDRDGNRIRRIRRDEYPELYRLHRQYHAATLGINMFGCAPQPWTLPEGPKPETEVGRPSENVYGYGNLHPGTA